MQLYICVVMACPTNLYMIRINTDFYIILGQKYGLPFQNCGMYETKAGTRAFSVATPTVWNSLPASAQSEGNIVSFRRRLKTYLFNAAYHPKPPSLLTTHALLSIKRLINPLVLSRH